MLVTGLNGWTWNGKENLLKAFATIYSSCRYVYEYIILIFGVEHICGNLF
jgi:hypothetical protein